MNKQFIKRIYNALLFSWAGLKSAWENEAAFRQEAILLVVLVPLAFWLGETVVEQIVLIGVWLLVIVVELINSAIEAVVDRISDERHMLSGQAKDMGSAAVLVSIVLAVLVWSGFLCERFFV